MENFSPHKSRKKLPFLRSRALDLWVQNQLYLQSGTGYPYQILNEHGESIDKAESSEISITILPTCIYYISACIVTNNNQHCIPCVFLPLVMCTMQPNTPPFKS